jgi:CheY-like chemotaxis protein
LVVSNCILVVEDDPMIGEFIEMALEDEGYQVISAANGRDALDIVRRQPLDAVILDMRMPIMDGCGFLAEYAETAPHRAPVIAVSANSRSSSCVTTDVVAFVAKPFDLNLLIDLVTKYTKQTH